MSHQEIWKPIPGFRGYEVSNMGRVRSYYYGRGTSEVPQRILKPQLVGNGQQQVILASQDKRLQQKLIKELVSDVFLGHKPIGYITIQKDGDVFNNKADNLHYVSRDEYLKERVGPKGITPNQAKKMRDLHWEGVSVRKLREQFSQISRTMIYYILSGKYFKEAGGPIRGIDY